MSNAIHSRALDKAFAKMTMLGFDIERLRKDLKHGNTGGISPEEFEQVVKGYETELQI